MRNFVASFKEILQLILVDYVDHWSRQFIFLMMASFRSDRNEVLVRIGDLKITPSTTEGASNVFSPTPFILNRTK